MTLPVLSSNAPSAGFISWTAFGMSYKDLEHNIAAGSTNKKFTWWQYNGGVNPQVMTSDTLPTDLTPDDALLFLNKGGIGAYAPSTYVIDGSYIVSGSLLADAIAANQIDTYHLKANIITTDQLAANAVTAADIAAGAVTTNKLSVGTVTDSRILNGSFEDGVQAWAGSGGTINIVTGASSSGQYAVQMTKGAGDIELHTDLSLLVPVTPSAGRKWYGSVMAGASAAQASGFSLRLWWFKADRVTPSAVTPTSVLQTGGLGTSYGFFSGQATPPSDAKYVAIQAIASTGIATGANVYVDDFELREVITAAQIADGAITTPKLIANAVTADKIAADTITAREIGANAITTQELAANAVTATNIAADAITSREIGANAITTLELAANAVTATSIAANAIVASAISAGAVSATAIAADAVTTDAIMANAVTANEIAVGTIEASNIKAGTLTADLLESTLILVSTLLGGNYDFDASAWVGGHWESDSSGIRLFDSTGRKSVDLPTDPKISALFEGNISAKSLTVQDYLALRGENNEFSKGSITTLAGGTTKPQTPPQPSIDYQVKPRAFGDMLMLGESGFTKVPNSSTYFAVSRFFGGYLDKFTESAGSFDPVSEASLGSKISPTGVTTIGSIVYVLCRDEARSINGFGKFYVRKYNATDLSFISEWQYQPSGTSTGVYSDRDPTIGTDGVDLFIAQCPNSTSGSGANEVVIRRYDTSGNLLATLNTALYLGDHLTSLNVGTFDVGATVYYVTAKNRGTAYAINAAGSAPDATRNWPLPKSTGYQAVVWDSTAGVFKTSGDNGVSIHTKHWWTDPALNTWWTAHSWFDSNTGGTGLHETLISEKVSFSMKKRARLSITTPALPATTGGLDDVTGVRIYHGTGAAKPTSANMKRAVAELADGVTTAIYTEPMDRSLAADTNTPPGFPASTPALVKRSDGTIDLAGDGNGVLQKAVADTGWVNIVLSSGYVEQGTPPAYTPQIRKIGNRVTMRGIVKPSSGTFAASAGVNVGTVPPDFLPGKDEYFIGITNPLGFSRVRVDPASGLLSVLPSVAAAWISLEASWLQN